MPYAALTDIASVKGWLRDQAPSDDGLLASLIDSLSEQAGRYCGRDNLGSIETYSETHRPPRYAGICEPARVVLRHYPVTALTAVMYAGTPVAIITDPMVAAATGVMLDDDKRTLLVFPGALQAGSGLPMIRVDYSAGYDDDSLPLGLTQAVNQWIGEVLKAQGWIGKTSEGMAGQTVSYEQGRQWNMSKRTKEMFEPFRNRVPF